MNRTYSQNAEAFIKENFALTDADLTSAYNVRFGANLTKAAMRKKRQRMSLPKSAADVRIAFCRLMNMPEDEISEWFTLDPPRDISKELARLEEARG
jgi:hypothetical protein